VDYRGYGDSTGKPTEIGTKIDILAGFQWLIEEKGMRPEEIILFGRSLGGSIAATIARDINPAGLVLESAFTSFDDVGAHYSVAACAVVQPV
jgi:acetyl esterase/lipase